MAARFWVGGSGTWDASSTANWSATSGGASGASAPGAADTATFDANSGTGTCTTAAGAVCTTCTLNSSTVVLLLGANLTTSSTFALTLGSLSLATYTLSSTTFSNSNANTRSISFGASGQITLTATSGTLWSGSTSTGFTTTGNRVVNAPNGGAGTRTFNFGTLSEGSSMTLNVSAGTDTLSLQGVYNSVNFTGFSGTVSFFPRTIYGSLTLSATATYSPLTATTSFVATSGTVTHTFNGKTLDLPVTFNAPGSTQILSDALTLGATRTLTLTAGTIRFKSGATSSAGTFAISGSPLVTLGATTSGLRATISQTTGTVNAVNATISDSGATGGATWQGLSANNAIDAGNNTGWIFDVPYGSLTQQPVRLRSFTERGRD